MKGAKRIPPNLKILQGTFRPGREVHTPPPLDSTIPVPPKRISKAALVIWNEIAPDLHAAGLLKRADKNNLAAYCQFAEEFYAANEKIQKEGTTLLTTNGNVVENPEFSVMKRAAELMLKFGLEFGLGSPVMRSRIDMSKSKGSGDKQPASKFGGMA